MPPQVNATLTRVTGATAATGGRDDWDAPGAEPAGAGAVKWEGAVPAYLRERAQRNVGAAGPDVVAARTLYVDTAHALPIGIDTDDVLTFIGLDGQEHQARAAVVAMSALPGVPLTVQTTRLELEER